MICKKNMQSIQTKILPVSKICHKLDTLAKYSVKHLATLVACLHSTSERQAWVFCAEVLRAIFATRTTSVAKLCNQRIQSTGSTNLPLSWWLSQNCAKCLTFVVRFLKNHSVGCRTVTRMFSIGRLCVCAGRRLDILKLTKTQVIYSASCFIFGGWSFVWGY